MWAKHTIRLAVCVSLLVIGLGCNQSTTPADKGSDKGGPVGQGNQAADLILGKWETVRKDAVILQHPPNIRGGVGKEERFDRPVTFEFRADGTMETVLGEIPQAQTKRQALSGKYRFVGENELEVTAEDSGKAEQATVKIKVTKHTLSITGPDGKAENYTRAK